MKIKVKSIEIGFSESNDVKPGIVDSFEAANRKLRVKAPDLGYYKTDFVVTWEDGQVYSGRFDIDADYMQLQTHISNVLKYYSGLHCPSHLTPEQYENSLVRTEKYSPNVRQEAKEFLDKYEL